MIYFARAMFPFLVAKAAGLTPDSLPADAEVSPELLEALANQSLSPEDIEIVQDQESGKSTLRSKSQLSRAMGGVKEGHIFVPPGKNTNNTWYMVTNNF